MKRLAALIASSLVVGAMASASAAEFPTKDIDIIVPFAPGGGVDTTSRIIVETANTLLEGAEFNVVNRAGGGGVVGQTLASQAAPDGYTVLAMTSSVVTNPKLKGASYSVDDFVPVGLYNLDPSVIVVPVDSPFETAEQFIAAAEAEPLNIVIAGIGTSHHMGGLAIQQVTEAQFNYVPTKGFGQQLQAVLGGHADGALWPLGEASSQAKTGGVRILSIASDARDENFPDVPTYQEAGIDIKIWATFRGWSVPKGTPDDVVATLSDLLQNVNETPAYREKMSGAGFQPVFRDAAGFQQIVDDYAALTSKIIEESGLGQ
ncbi:MAG: tripartite tricarboxylate transporter substrate binding protein [Kiloniellales bacterium]